MIVGCKVNCAYMDNSYLLIMVYVWSHMHVVMLIACSSLLYDFSDVCHVVCLECLVIPRVSGCVKYCWVKLGSTS